MRENTKDVLRRMSTIEDVVIYANSGLLVIYIEAVVVL
jgi:hypothetical protein